MVSLQVSIGRHRNIGIQKQRRKPGSSTQRNHWDEKVSKIGLDFGPEGGVDSAWILRGFLGGREKRAETIRVRIRHKIRSSFR